MCRSHEFGRRGLCGLPGGTHCTLRHPLAPAGGSGTLMDLAEPARQPPRKPFVPALSQRRKSARRFSRVTYWPAAWNRTISSAGTRPLSLTSMPWPLAQARTSDGVGPPGREEALPVLARREVPPPALRAASMKAGEPSGTPRRARRSGRSRWQFRPLRT